MTFSPVDMSNGSTVATAQTPAEYWGYVWQGYYVLSGVAPVFTSGDIPRSLITTKGDLIVGTSSGIPTNQPVGADGLFLKADSASPTGVSWASASAGGILASQFDAKGDLLVGTANDALSRFATGSNGQVLTAQSGQATGLLWATLAKADVGLGSVDNTADTAKPVSTAQQTALNLKANLASPTFTGTVGGVTASMVGLGSVNNTADSAKPVSTAQQTALDLKANLASPTFTGTVGGVTASMVGLGSVNNTADSAKPVSTAQQTALDGKADRLTPAVLSATQANSTVTPAVLTGHTFVIPPGKTLILNGQMIFTSAATTTGAALGIRVAQPVSASAAAIGSCSIEVALSSAAVATGLRDGDAFNVAANTNAFVEVVGTDTVAGNNAAAYQCVIKNQAAGHSTTVTVEFRSEVAASAITAQIGTGAVPVLV